MRYIGQSGTSYCKSDSELLTNFPASKTKGRNKIISCKVLASLEGRIDFGVSNCDWLILMIFNDLPLTNL